MIKYGEHTFPPVGGIACYKGVDVTIGNYCSIASGMKIISGQHPCVAHPQVVSQYPFLEHWGVDYPPCQTDGVVVIGNDVWIGEDVTLLAGVTINDGAIIGAKTVVTKDVLPYTVFAGNPGEVKKFRFSISQMYALYRIKWWDWDEAKIREAVPYMKDIDTFLATYG